jgi:acetoin utilization protein AcuC
LAYDFGPGHPLTPRRFGPGIDLLATVGARPGLAPQPAPDDALEAVHAPSYVQAVRRLSADPGGRPEAGIGPGDTPPFAGMHEAAAAVAGGSLGAMDAILSGRAGHAFHPGGGLHHAMAARGSGFCVYNDVALAIRRARDAGLRVLYLDFDVHHGDGVEAIHHADPGVLTFSIHETGESLFPGSGFIGDDTPGAAAGTAVNLPLEAGTGAEPWLAAIERLVPELAAAFGPDVVVSQHGCDGHAWDPLAHLRLTTTAMGAAARLVDAVAHRHAEGRWLATGGGGYDVYRVVPRTWSLVWLAGAHRGPPDALPAAWRERWAGEAERHGQAPLPHRFEDDPELGQSAAWAVDADRRTQRAVELVRRLAVPALIRAAVDGGWWQPDRAAGGGSPTRESTAPGAQGRHPNGPLAPASTGGPKPDVIAAIGRDAWGGLVLADRVAGPVAGAEGHRIVAGALASGRDRVFVSAAVTDGRVVGLALSARDAEQPVRRLLALGVAPGWRGQGIGEAVLAAHLAEIDARRDGEAVEAVVTAAERDAVDPAPRDVRAAVARRLLEGSGFRVAPATGELGRADPQALQATRPA